MRFDLVISFDAQDRNAVYQEVTAKVHARFPEYALQATMDTDFAES